MVKVGTGVIVRRNGRVLVGFRKGSHGAGCLAFPGGHIDDTDVSFEQQAAREVFEETGMVVKVVPAEGRLELFTTFDILDGIHRYVTVYIVADYIEGGNEYEINKFTPLEEDKCEGWQFITYGQLVNSLTDKDKIWIPIDYINHHLDFLFKNFE